MSTQLQEDEHVEENGLVTASPDNMSEASEDEEDEHVNGNGDVHGNAEMMHARQADYGSGSEDEDEEEEGEEDEDEGEDEEEDDEEPALKYERLGGIAHQLLQKDSASSLAYANQRLVSRVFLPHILL